MAKKKAAAQPLPLTLHKSGQWVKKLKVNGRWVIKYFGKDREKALAKWADEKDYWLAGRTPPARQTRQVATVEYACESYAQSKLLLLELGKVKKRYTDEVLEFCRLVMETLGRETALEDLTPADFDNLLKVIVGRWGLERQKKSIGVCRSILKYAFECGFVDRPVRTGPNFKAPSREEFRRHRLKTKPIILQPEQLRAIIDAANVEFRAMFLLGLNCGLLPSELAESLEAKHIDGDRLRFDRDKAGTPRSNILWPETVEAIKALGHREGLLFPGWNRWRVSDTYRQLTRELGFYVAGRVTFKALRNHLKTIGAQCGDTEAVAYAMGHIDGSIGARYLDSFPEARLRLVSDTIRQWLFGKVEPPPSEAKRRTGRGTRKR